MDNLVFTQLSVTEVRTMLREEVRNVLAEQATNSQGAKDEFLNISQLSDYINHSVPSIYGLVHRRKIPFIKRCKRLMFEKEKINQWLRGGSIKTQAEIKQEAKQFLSDREV